MYEQDKSDVQQSWEWLKIYILRSWSESVDIPTDLRIRCVHVSLCWFLYARLV